jgi:acyl carrier protein
MAISDARIETDLLAILKRVSEKPIEPALHSDLVRDLGFDSLRWLELIAELEDHFDIVIPLNETGSIRSVRGVRDHVRMLIATQAAAR